MAKGKTKKIEAEEVAALTTENIINEIEDMVADKSIDTDTLKSSLQEIQDHINLVLEGI